MNDATLQALAVLANKLGTTAEYLWAALLKQAPISGMTDLLMIVLWGAGCATWCNFVRKKFSNTKDLGEDVSIALAWFSAGVFILITAIYISDKLPKAISALVNPEYWALHQILK